MFCSPAGEKIDKGGRRQLDGGEVLTFTHFCSLVESRRQCKKLADTIHYKMYMPVNIIHILM